MTRVCVLAVDVGTSSVRALLYRQTGSAVPGAQVHLPYQPRLAADGTAEVDFDRLARLTQGAVSELLRIARPRDVGAIGAVGVSTFWHGLLAADGDGRALTPVYLWSDTRSSAAAELLAARADAARITARTGCPIHSSYWPAKLLWLRGWRPDLWGGRVRWLSFGDLLYWRLFAELGTSLSMASGTGLFRLADCRWDEELLGEVGISLEALPAVARTATGLVPRYARMWPQLAGLPWLYAAGDGALANLGSGCVDATQRALTVGTSGALRVMHTGEPPRLPAGLWTYRLDAERLVTGGALSNGGNLYAWLVHSLRVKERNLERDLASIAPASHGLTFLPHLAGQRSLGYAPHAFGAVAGLRSATTALDIVRAGLEAVALDFAAVDQRLDEVLPGARRLVASGAGLLSSPVWMQMMADAIGKPVAEGRAQEASSRGAAVFALECLGLSEAAEPGPGVGRTHQPDAAAGAAYRAAQARQEELYRLLIRG